MYSLNKDDIYCALLIFWKERWHCNNFFDNLEKNFNDLQQKDNRRTNIVYFL